MRSFLLALLPLAVATVAPSRGADAPPADQAAPVLSEQIEVTATLRPEERAEVPATVRVVSGDEARARDVESVAELLATTAGAQSFTLGPLGQQSSLFVRGTDSNQTLVLWNGIPLDDPFFGGFNFAFLPADELGRVEVVPGPFSALYGSSAMGGVVQVLTDTRPGARLRLEAGQRDQRRVSFGAAGATGPLDGWLSGHWREGNGGLGNDDYRSRELAGRIGHSATTSDVGLIARWNHSTAGIPFDGLLPSPHRSIDWHEDELGLPWSTTGTAWDASGSLSTIHYENSFDDPDQPFHEDTDSRVDRARALATLHASSRGWWGGGAEWERDTVTDRSDFGTSLDGARQRTIGVFTQLHATWRRVTADVGVRHDDNDVYGGATSPRLGVVVAATDAVRLRASYGESFRAPAVGELFFPFFGNRDLRPERGRSEEMGVQVGNGPLQLDAALFRNRQRDLIDYDTALGHNVNVGRAQSRGADAELRLEEQRFSLRVGGTRLSAVDLDSGAPLLNRPRSSAHLVAIARPGRAELSLVTTYVGPRWNPAPDFSPAPRRNGGYSTVDVAGSLAVRAGLTPYVRVTNVLDRRYQPVLGFPAPARTFVAGVRTAW